jgi:predicted phosphodiesterase
MRLGLISDVHGNLAALEAVLAELDAAGVDAIVFAGDAVSYYPAVNETLDLLRARVRWAITGNHDCYFLGRLPMPPQVVPIANPGHFERAMSAENRAWLGALRAEQDLVIDRLRVMLRHGSPWAIEEYIYPDHGHFERFAPLEADLVVLGHTHRPWLYPGPGPGRPLPDAPPTLLNPGSVGQSREWLPRARLAIVDLARRRVTLHALAYPDDACRAALARAGLSPRSCHLRPSLAGLARRAAGRLLGRGPKAAA